MVVGWPYVGEAVLVTTQCELIVDPNVLSTRLQSLQLCLVDEILAEGCEMQETVPVELVVTAAGTDCRLRFDGTAWQSGKPGALL